MLSDDTSEAVVSSQSVPKYVGPNGGGKLGVISSFEAHFYIHTISPINLKHALSRTVSMTPYNSQETESQNKLDSVPEAQFRNS